MNSIPQNKFDPLTEELFVFLDDSIFSAQQMLENLTELRAAVIRRDEKALLRITEQMPQMTADRDAMQMRQQRICQAFAVLLNCPAAKVTLSYISEFMEPARKAELKTKQHLLRELTGRLSSQRLGTELLLRECERLNRMVLDGIVGRANQTFTYGSAGRVQRDMHCAIMSTRM